MIILKDIICKYGQRSVQVELPRANMVIDHRPIILHGEDSRNICPRFRFDYNGTTVTIIRVDNNTTSTWISSFSFRVYDPATETVPSFDSSIYTYMGEDDELAPKDTTLLIMHPSVTVIKSSAFSHCKKIKKCFMYDEVHTIESFAFSECEGMKVIRLSQKLRQIGEYAFKWCPLEAVFLPPSVNQIDRRAFCGCKNLRILPLPPNIDTSKLGSEILGGCDDFFWATDIDGYSSEGDYNYETDSSYQQAGAIEESKRVHQNILPFYRDQVPPLHKVCLDTHVTHQTIQQCINTHGRATASIIDHDEMTPLHILSMNPHADISALRACFDLDLSSAIVKDSRGNTPLDYLRVHRDTIDDHTSLVFSLCMHRDAAAAGLSQDHKKTTTNMNKKRKIVK